MLVSSERGASEIVSSQEETRFYDDIGCLAADWRAHRAGDIAYVHVNGEWSEAGVASFAQPASARTAMGSGWVAYATVGEARAADRDGRARTWDEVLHVVTGR
jgi:hypothetical protein